MSHEIELRPPVPEDLPAIGDLYRAVKGRPRPESATRHRFFGTPWGDSPALIAMDGDVCVAAALAWPAPMRVGEQLVLAGQGTDAVTHPDYRGRPRLFIGLVRTAMEIVRDRGIDVYYTFPNESSIKLLKLVAGTYLGTAGAWGMAFERRRWPFRRQRPVDVDVGEPEWEELSNLIEIVHGDRTVIRVEKNRDWLDWRYAEATAERYEWLHIRDDSGRLSAAALVGERDSALWSEDFAGLWRIHELFAVDETAGEKLLRGIASRLGGKGARKLDVLVKDPVLERAVERAGFVRETERPVTTYLFRPEPLSLDIEDFAHWRLVSGDMDFF